MRSALYFIAGLVFGMALVNVSLNLILTALWHWPTWALYPVDIALGLAGGTIGTSLYLRWRDRHA